MAKGDVWRVRIVRVGGRASEIAVARVLGVPLGEAVTFLKRLPAELPLNLGREEAETVADEIRVSDSRVEIREVVNPSAITCQAHPHLCNDGQCKRCNAWICTLCRSQNSKGLCPECSRKSKRSEGFRSLRIGILLVVLMVVVGLAWRHTQQKEARRSWERPLNVQLVLLEDGQGVDTEAIETLKSRVPALERVLAAQYQAWGLSGQPFRIRVVGPITGPEVPTLEADGWWARAGFAWALHGFESEIEELLLESPRNADMRIYMVLRRPTSRVRDFEGIAAPGGSVGLVEIDLAEDMVDLGLITATHEFFHTLGASDKYDMEGKNLIPEGLADTEKEPMFPQVALEIMARTIPVSAQEERLPRTIDEIRVNRYTADEIGWTRNK